MKNFLQQAIRNINNYRPFTTTLSDLHNEHNHTRFCEKYHELLSYQLSKFESNESSKSLITKVCKELYNTKSLYDIRQVVSAHSNTIDKNTDKTTYDLATSIHDMINVKIEQLIESYNDKAPEPVLEDFGYYNRHWEKQISDEKNNGNQKGGNGRL